MKKSVLLLLALTLLLIHLSSCAESYELLYEVEQDGWTYCVRGNGTQARQIVIKEGERVLWSQRVRVDTSVGNRNNCYGFAVTDLNFDGRADLMLATNVTGELVSYRCWLRDGTGASFVASEPLSALCNIGVDRKLEAIFGFEQTREERENDSYSVCDKATKYVWSNGNLLPQMYAAVTYYSASDLYCYSVAYYDETERRFGPSSDKWLSSEDYQAADLQFLYYFRVSQPVD